jgi:hypothetical protein
VEDYRKVQEFLLHGERPELKRLKDVEPIVRNMCIARANEGPEMGVIPVWCSKSDRDNCIITYATYNHSFSQGVDRLVRKLQMTDYEGHILYRIGGWPNCEEGDLRLAHVPYAFKVCFFREARRLGYKRVLWLDASIVPFGSLRTIFEKIRRVGYFIQDNSHFVGEFMNEEAAKALGVSVKETEKMVSCSAAIIGIDFTFPGMNELIDDWYKMACHPDAFFTPRADQTVLSILLHQKGLTQLISLKRLGSPVSRDGNTLFIMDREFVKPKG